MAFPSSGGDVPAFKPQKFGHFEQTDSFSIKYAPSSITTYVSTRSGLTVVVADRKGPKVTGQFVLATEIFDDSGAPHTLEHLVFMGSRSYHYKGLLDKIATRAYSGTNAWTSVDHTSYTLESAGWDGFVQILPVYLEHVLLPVLTDEACTTEVWHINEEGNDAGVVYSEMQGIQYRSLELMDLAAKRTMYPENVGFRYETGGMMEALRVLTPERIREFHRAMYQPRNLCVIVVGEVDHQNLLETLEAFEESIKDAIPPLDSPFKRPWVDSPQPLPLEKTSRVTVEFPEEDESMGEVQLIWFGVDCMDQVNFTAQAVLLSYLSGSSASILENRIVEKAELASAIHFYSEARPMSTVYLMAAGVKTEKLEEVEKMVLDLLKEVAETPLDMTYLRSCLSRERLQIMTVAEESSSFFYGEIITDHLFGKRDGTTMRQLEDLSEFDTLNKWTEDEWRDFHKKIFLDGHHVTLFGKPSLAMANKIKEDETARIAKRKENLGPDGLAKATKKLEDAKAKNEQPIPDEVIEQWKIPSTDSIHFIKSQSARSGRARELGPFDNEAQKIVDKAVPGKHSLFIQFEDVPTNFVHLFVHVGTEGIPVQQKPLFDIFCELFFNTEVMRGGKKTGFEEMVMELERDTISYAVSGSRQLGDPEGIMITFSIEPEKYRTIIGWLKTLICDVVVEPERIMTVLAKLLASIPEIKRDGRYMGSEVDLALHIDPSNLSVAKRTLVRALYYRRLKKLLKTDPEAVVGWMKAFYRQVFTPENIRVFITANVARLSDPVSAWDVLSSSLCPGSEGIGQPVPIKKMTDRLSKEGQNPGSIGAVIIPMKTLDSSFSVSTTKGLPFLADDRLPAVMVAVAYLEAPEGPLWKAVRGQGFAYGAYFVRDMDTGLLQYKVYRSPDATKAMSASREALKGLADGTTPVDKPLMLAAVSQIVVLMADEQATMAIAAQKNYMLSVVKGLDLDWTEKLLASVKDVTPEQMTKVIKDLMLPVFEPGKSNIVITCAPTMAEVGFLLAFPTGVQLTCGIGHGE